MIRTQIILPSSGVIDLYDDVDMSYNYNVVDVREPEKGIADYSKTIIVPGTRNNNQLFKHQFDINIDSIWDTRKKIKCSVIVDDVEILRGFLRLMKIIQRGNNDYDYEVNIIGNTASIFKDVGGDELTVLNLSRLNHTYNRTNIVASWSAVVGEGYVYPFMDQGNFPVNENSLVVENFLPAIYVKEYIDRIFEYYGYQYSSAFFESDFFKRLIIPFNSERLRYTDSEITARQWRVSRESSDHSISMINDNVVRQTVLDFNNDSSSPNINPNGYFSLASDRFTIASGKRGVYSFVFSGTIDLGAFNADPDISGNLIIDIIIRISDSNNNVKAEFSETTLVPTTSALQTQTVNIISQGIDMQVGDYAQCLIQFADIAGRSTIKIKTGTYLYNRVANNMISEGATMEVNSTIPIKIKISDFISAIKKLFNLYFSFHKDISNKYIIEPRDDWYLSAIVNWDDKIDISRDFETIPVGELDAKRYVLQYRKDEDYYNITYFDRFQESYGLRKKTIDTDFVKNDYIIEPIFSPSPLHSSTSNDRVFVKIRNKDGAAMSGVVSHGGLSTTISSNYFKTNIRILYYGGLKSCQTWEFPKGITMTTYPFAGHIDDPINPSIDLSYGVPREVYYLANQLGATYTNNNLYNVYWRNLIDEMTDKNARIINAYFKLTPADINALDMRKIYYFRGDHWRLNKIMDYNPISNITTKCEFVKLRTAKTAFN